MKCKFVRHTLLGSATTARPSPLVADHLARCAACREWQRQLVRVERLVPELPVPPSDAKAECLHAVLHSEAFVHSGPPELGWRRRERALRKVAITFAMAAGLLFFALIWFAWQQQRDQTRFAATTHQAKAHYTLDHVIDQHGDGKPLPAEPRQRIERLAVVAEKIQGATKERVLNGTVPEVTVLTDQFEVLLVQGILPLARVLPAAESSELLAGIAEQLSRTESMANQLARQRSDVANPLQEMAKVAHNGHVELRELARGKA